METGLAGKKGLITGGSTGIGLGIARALASEGVELVVAGLDPDPEAMAELGKLSGRRAIFLKVDVSEESAVVGMVRQAIDQLDGLNLYINNAAWTWHEPVTKVTRESFYKTIDTNLAACVWACREVSRYMIPRRAGSILIVGSTVKVGPSYRETSYRISKMGLKMYMETLAIELVPYGIRVNMLTPGGVRTRLVGTFTPRMFEIATATIPMRRFAHADEIGPAAAFLLSDRLSSYTTGADLVVDGGWSLRPVPWLSDEELFNLNLPPGTDQGESSDPKR